MGDLNVTVMYCVGLPEKDWRVRVVRANQRWNTQTDYSTKTPTFDETFALKIADPVDPLRLEVWESNHILPDRFFGSCTVPLVNLPWQQVVLARPTFPIESSVLASFNKKQPSSFRKMMNYNNSSSGSNNSNEDTNKLQPQPGGSAVEKPVVEIGIQLKVMDGNFIVVCNNSNTTDSSGGVASSRSSSGGGEPSSGGSEVVGAAHLHVKPSSSCAHGGQGPSSSSLEGGNNSQQHLFMNEQIAGVQRDFLVPISHHHSNNHSAVSGTPVRSGENSSCPPHSPLTPNASMTTISLRASLNGMSISEIALLLTQFQREKQFCVEREDYEGAAMIHRQVTLLKSYLQNGGSVHDNHKGRQQQSTTTTSSSIANDSTHADPAAGAMTTALNETNFKATPQGKTTTSCSSENATPMSSPERRKKGAQTEGFKVISSAASSPPRKKQTQIANASPVASPSRKGPAAGQRPQKKEKSEGREGSNKSSATTETKAAGPTTIARKLPPPCPPPPKIAMPSGGKSMPPPPPPPPCLVHAKMESLAKPSKTKTFFWQKISKEQISHQHGDTIWTAATARTVNSSSILGKKTMEKYQQGNNKEENKKLLEDFVHYCPKTRKTADHDDEKKNHDQEKGGGKKESEEKPTTDDVDSNIKKCLDFLFAKKTVNAAPNQQNSGENTTTGGLKQPLVKKVPTILDGNREKNVGIVLRFLRLKEEVLTKAIENLDDEILSDESICSLISILPTPDEMSLVEQHYGHCIIGKMRDKKEKDEEEEKLNIAKASQAVRFYALVCGNIPDIETRLRCWLFKLRFDAHTNYIEERVQSVQLAIQSVQANSGLRAITQFVLRLGNYLNGGAGVTLREAGGFKMAQDLEKLSAFVATNSGIGFSFQAFLRYYAAKTAQKKKKKLQTMISAEEEEISKKNEQQKEEDNDEDEILLQEFFECFHSAIFKRTTTIPSSLAESVKEASPKKIGKTFSSPERFCFFDANSSSTSSSSAECSSQHRQQHRMTLLSFVVLYFILRQQESMTTVLRTNASSSSSSSLEGELEAAGFGVPFSTSSSSSFRKKKKSLSAQKTNNNHDDAQDHEEREESVDELSSFLLQLRPLMITACKVDFAMLTSDLKEMRGLVLMCGSYMPGGEKDNSKTVNPITAFASRAAKKVERLIHSFNAMKMELDRFLYYCSGDVKWMKTDEENFPPTDSKNNKNSNNAANEEECMQLLLSDEISSYGASQEASEMLCALARFADDVSREYKRIVAS